MKILKNYVLAGLDRSEVFHIGILRCMAALIALSIPFASASEPTGNQLIIEEVTVTAQKREQFMGDVPVSISVLSGDALVERGINDVFDVALQVPSLQVVTNTQPMTTSFRIRGLGNDGNIPNFEPAVGFFIDGVFMPRSGLAFNDLVDIERIEILKGPQSTLYGKNTTAGVIHIITRVPGQEFESHVEVSLSSLDGANNAFVKRYVGRISGGISDSVAGSLSAVYYDQEGTDINLADGSALNDMERYSVRGQIFADIGESSSLRVIGTYTKMPTSSLGNPDLFQGAVPRALNALFGGCPDEDPYDRRYCLNAANYVSMTTKSIAATFETSVGGNSLTSVTAYQEYDMLRSSDDVDQTLLLLARMEDTQAGENFSQELRFASPSSEVFEWLVGAYYFNSKFERGNRGQTPFFELLAHAPLVPLVPGIPLGQPGDLGFLDSRTDSEYYALFGQGTYFFSDQWNLTFGLRYGDESKDVSINNSTDTAGPLNILTLVMSPTAANAELHRSKGRWTWNSALQFSPTDDSMFYFNYARGSKTGSYNSGFGNTLAENRGFDDEVVDHFELGSKLTLLDGRMTLDSAIFYSDFDDFQNAGFVGLQFLVNNAEKVSSKGFETEGHILISEEWAADFALSYVKAEYDEYTGGSCYFGRVPDNADGTACVLTGSALPFVPEWSTFVGLQYGRQASFGDLFGRLEWAWVDDHDTNTNLDPRHVQGSYSVVNARFGVGIGKLDLVLWANNLFNENIVAQTATAAMFPADPAYMDWLGRPREIGVTARYHF
jgi:outer membrane receptor protein involved in Fe transport